MSTTVGSVGVVERLVVGLLDGTVEVVELTRVLSEETPVLQLPEPEVSLPRFRLEELSRYDDRGPDHFWNVIHVAEHSGTHLDAPVHWITGRGGLDVSEIPPASLVRPAVVVHRVDECDADADYQLEVEDLVAFQDEHGQFPDGAWLFLHTGWDRRAGDPVAYVNRGADGQKHWPGLSVECALWLVEETNIVGFGVDTLGLDAGVSWSMEPQHPTHNYLLGAGRMGISNLTGLDRLPPVGAVVFAGPLRVAGGSASPARVLALVDARNGTGA